MFDQGKLDAKLVDRGKPSPLARREGFYAQRLTRALSLVASLSLKYGLQAADIVRRFVLSLSGQLVIFTAVFVIVVEAVIVIPSLASDHERWLLDRVRQAEIASQSIDVAQNNAVSKEVSNQLRKSAGVLYLAVEINGETYRLYDSKVAVPDEILDLRQSHKDVFHDIAYLWAPWKTFTSRPDRLIHIVAQPKVRGGQKIEIVVKAEPLKTYLKSSLASMLRVSLSISFLAGFLIFIGLSVFIVRPVRQLTKGIVRFKANPEDASATYRPSDRPDEIGQIEREIASMQEEVRQSLRSRARLAALGQAVSKINHDLRNMLTAAQMASDRLANSADPTVAKALPRLERALDRALSLATNVLTYGKSDEQTPQIQIVRLRDLSEAAAEDAGLSIGPHGPETIRYSCKIAKGFFLEADPEQLHRLLVNLMRNARQAIELQPNRKARGRVTLTAIKTTEDVFLIVSDNGPGIPEKLREKLFQPFTSSTTPGGSGLGLAIARELAQLHGGDVRLVSSGAEGTTFEVRLPLKG
ncbi:HAMP domain-containing sensor histidine kinase [Asticcacaulis sp. 201]|uniref:sensor histidine kinase n=1 Tax=Asticcacaulis sp. 201 TaxID=3028787 RepID=UPI002916DBC9|nr:HAMP domain-containing sensor histidine kinase [Asticcacaulis sp. 201]MDV6330482.1 HAMP domain-containing sensor histidine kinase [Asticcacaulis sp. 201]